MDIDRARKMRSGGATYQRIASEFNVSRQRVHQLLTGYSSKVIRRRIKRIVLTHHGGGRLACVRCGCDNVRALQLYVLRPPILKEGFPGEYQTLCTNCR